LTKEKIRATLGKHKRIKQKRIFDTIFKSGQSKMVYPIRMNWVIINKRLDNPFKVAFVVPKRLFKKAPDRNAIKRQMKEAFRLNQFKLGNAFEEQAHSVCVLWIYQAKTKLPYEQIEKGIIKGMQKIIRLNELD